MSPTQEIQHPLTLKVLRLSNPKFFANDPEVPSFNLPGQVMSDFLSLPFNFGILYTGEQLECYVSVVNDSKETQLNVSFKAELQSNSNRITLVDSSAEGNLQAGIVSKQASEFMIKHHIKESGLHILVCSVHYTSPGNQDRRFFRKFFSTSKNKP